MIVPVAVITVGCAFAAAFIMAIGGMLVHGAYHDIRETGSRARAWLIGRRA